jgi:hypothetical protein
MRTLALERSKSGYGKTFGFHVLMSVVYCLILHVFSRKIFVRIMSSERKRWKVGFTANTLDLAGFK